MMTSKKLLKFLSIALCCTNFACEPKDEIKTEINYGDACCCSPYITSNNGSGIFVPSCFTPNGDNINDVFNVLPISNVKAIYNVQFSSVNANGNTISNLFTLDTMYSSASGINKGYNGTIVNNNGTFEGNFKATMQILNNNNSTSYVTVKSTAYRCNADNANALQFKTNCKLQDQFDPVTGVANLPTNDPCFK